MVYKTYRIGDICTIVKGKYPTLKTEPGEYPLVVTAAYRRSASTYQMEGPAVCVPLISSTGHGDAALHRVHYQEGKFALANLLVALLPKDSNTCYSKYLYHLLMAKKDKYLVPLMQGTANVSLKEQDIANVEIPLPLLAEQRRIVARIEELAAKIEEARGLRKKAGEELEALAHSTLRYILETNANNPKWEFGNIPQFAEVNPSRRGKTDFSPLMPVSFVPMAAVDDTTGSIVRATIRPYAEVSKGYTWFNDGDIIFARITPCMQNGKVAIAEGLANSIGFGSTEFHVLRPGPKIIGRWLYILMRHKDFKKDAETHFKGTAGQQRVPQSFLQQKVIPIPPLPEQRRIVAYLDEIQAKVDALRRLQEETGAELDALMPAVLDRAFKGEL